MAQVEESQLSQSEAQSSNSSTRKKKKKNRNKVINGFNKRQEKTGILQKYKDNLLGKTKINIKMIYIMQNLPLDLRLHKFSGY
jgi:hypothetical protein